MPAPPGHNYNQGSSANAATGPSNYSAPKTDSAKSATATGAGKTNPSSPGLATPGGKTTTSAAKAAPAKASPAPSKLGGSGLKSEAAVSKEVADKAKATSPGAGKTASNLDRALAVARGAGTVGKAEPSSKAPSDATISSLKRESTGSTSHTPVSQKGILSGPQTYSGPKGAGVLNEAARFAAAKNQGFNAPKVNASPKDIDAMARMMLAESQSISNEKGGILTPALQGVGDVIRNRILSDQFPDDAFSVISQKRQFSPFEDGGFKRIDKTHPDYAMARDLAESILSGESPSQVGGALNFANLDTVYGANSTASAKTKQQFSELKDDPGSVTFKDARNPNRVQHTFGTIGESDVAFNAPRETQTASADPVMDAFREVMGSPDLVSNVRADERPAQNLLSRTQLADLSRVVAQPQAPSVAAVDSAAAARRGLKPAAGPIPNPPAPQMAQTPQTPPTVHPDRLQELASRRLPAQPLVNTKSATAVEGRPPSAIAPGFEQYSPDVQQRIAAALEAVFSDPSRQQDLAPQQTRDYTNMPSRDPSLAGAVAQGADIDEAQAVAQGIWGGEPETAQASTGDPVLDAIRDIFGGTPPAEAASPVNRQLKEALDPYGDDPGFMSQASTMTAERPKPVPDERTSIPIGDDRTYPTSNEAVKSDRTQGIAAAIAALGGVVPEQSPSLAKLAPPHAPYPAPTPRPNPMRQQPDAEVASVGGRYTGTAAPRAPEAPPAPELTGIAPSLKTADVKGILGTMTDILGAPKSDLEVPSMPEAPQTSVITPKQSQLGYTNPPRTFVRELPVPGPLPPVTERGVVPSPNTATPPGIKPGSPVAPPADMFEDGIRPQPAPKPIETPPARFVPGQPAQIATPGAPLAIDPQRQKSPYPSEEESRFATEEQERAGTKMVTEMGPKANRYLTQISQHKQQQQKQGGRKGGAENVIRLANQIRQKSQGLANPDTVTPSEPPNASGLTNQQIAAILQAIGAAA